MRVGFLSNQLDNRGTGNAMFDYAHYNEVILKNESFIYTYRVARHSPIMINKMLDRFGNPTVLEHPDEIMYIDDIDILYHIKYGDDDGVRAGVKYAVHAVFTNAPHADRYATVSEWLSRGTTIPYVPHMITFPRVTRNFRKLHGIPETAVVFGRYGSFENFDIPFVWDVMDKILGMYNNTWFIFANTEEKLRHPRIIYMSELDSQERKAAFIDTCDYMLHARGRGETFGISVGEFAIRGKPIITYGKSGETAHIDILKKSYDPYIYMDQFDLYLILDKLSKSRVRLVKFAYTDFTPEKVMEKFKEVFLS